MARRTGISSSRISSYVKGDRIPTAENLSKLAQGMGVSTDWILHGNVDGSDPASFDESLPPVPGSRPQKSDLSEFSERLAGLMADRNMSASDLAHIIGIDRRVVSNWLRGKNWPRDETMRKLAKLFGVSRWELVAGGGVPEPKELIFMGPSKEALGVDKGGGAGPDEKDERIKKLLTDMERDDSLREKMLDYYEYLKSRAEKSGKTREDKGGKE